MALLSGVCLIDSFSLGVLRPPLHVLGAGEESGLCPAPGEQAELSERILGAVMGMFWGRWDPRAGNNSPRPTPRDVVLEEKLGIC